MDNNKIKNILNDNAFPYEEMKMWARLDILNDTFNSNTMPIIFLITIDSVWHSVTLSKFYNCPHDWMWHEYVTWIVFQVHLKF